MKGKRSFEPGGKEPTPTRPAILAVGVLLVALSAVGFATVADDLRHVGEILGVASILIAGLAFFLASYPNPVSRNLRLLWIAAGSIAGAIAGAATDHMALGVGCGVFLGLVVAAVGGRRSDR